MLAKWPLTVMTEGAVGCRVVVEGRCSLRSRWGEATAAMTTEECSIEARETEARRERDDEIGSTGSVLVGVVEYLPDSPVYGPLSDDAKTFDTSPSAV